MFCKQTWRTLAILPENQLHTRSCGCSCHGAGFEFANSSGKGLCELGRNTPLTALSHRQLPGAAWRLWHSCVLHMGILLTLSAGERWSARENKYAPPLLLVTSINRNFEFKACFQGWLWDVLASWTWENSGVSGLISKWCRIKLSLQT